jgi:hypothetical protein
MTPWELVFAAGTLILALAIIYGFVQYKRRNKANDAVTAEGTRELYADPAAYMDGQREELKKKVKPD